MTNANGIAPGVDEKLIAKILQIKGIMEQSKFEGEVANAAAQLQRLLEEHNLDIADLEGRGAKTAPGVVEHGYDLAKAAFQWKLDLGYYLAKHYFCNAIIWRHPGQPKTISFIGRPDNVEAMKMLYGWVIRQIVEIARTERPKWEAEHGEHIDPLRWQVNFGAGAVQTVAKKLNEIKAQQAADVKTNALVLHHEAEISDYTEEKYGWRNDGGETKAQRKAREEREARERAMEELKERDPEEFYRQHPWLHPDAVAKRQAELAAEIEALRKREERNAKRRQKSGGGGGRVRHVSEETYRKEEQAYSARSAGRKAGDKVNLQPFIERSGAGKSAGEVK